MQTKYTRYSNITCISTPLVGRQLATFMSKTITPNLSPAQKIKITAMFRKLLEN